MKKIFSLFVLIWVLVLSGCGWWDAQLYHDNIFNAVKDCVDSNNEFYNNFNEGAKVEAIVELLQANIESCQASKEKIETLWNFKKDSSFKDAAINFLDKNINYLEIFLSTSGYRNLETITDEDMAWYKSVSSQLEIAVQELDSALNDLPLVQNTFAQKHGIKLETEQMPDIIDENVEDAEISGDAVDTGDSTNIIEAETDIQSPENDVDNPEISENTENTQDEVVIDLAQGDDEVDNIQDIETIQE